jgi:uncharacterized membrane protein YoaK (UPF0700 family)
MGMQDAAVLHFGGISINTVFITGDLVSFSDALAELPSNPSSSRRTALRIGGVWLGYVGGAVVGAIVARLHVSTRFDPRFVVAVLAIGAIAAFAALPPARTGDQQS